MAMVVAVEQPEGTLLPELVQWLPSAGLDEPIGTIGAAALRETAAIYREKSAAATGKFAGPSAVDRAAEQVLADARAWLKQSNTGRPERA